MSTVDLTIPKSMVITTEPYESIKPSISITVKDIPIEKLEALYPALSIFSEELFKLEILNLYNLFYNIKDDGLKNYMMDLVKNKLGNLEENIQVSMDTIKDI